MEIDQETTLSRIIKIATLIEKKEIRTVLLSFLLIFTLMSAYYILRPVRDAMASDWSNTEISMLWNIQLFLSATMISAYGMLVSRIRFKLLVPAVYGLFAITFVAFYFAATAVENRTLVDKAFYSWVSLFALFHVSVFWSFMADNYNKEQSRRLFPLIYVGASLGAIVGGMLAAILVQSVGTDSLILVAATLLLIPIPIIFYIQHLKIIEYREKEIEGDGDTFKIGGNPLAGFKSFVTNPYLMAIGGFLLLYTATSSFVYLEQTNLLRDYSREERTVILASLSTVVNILTFGLGLFVTGRLVTRLGMALTLALVPVFICIWLIILAFAPVLTILLVLQVVRQGGNYGITRSAREMLFTHVSREDKFKAKPVVDVVVYRGGDAVSGMAFAGLTDGLGLGIAAMAGIGAAIAAIWAAMGLYLGKVFAHRPVSQSEASTNSAGLQSST